VLSAPFNAAIRRPLFNPNFFYGRTCPRIAGLRYQPANLIAADRVCWQLFCVAEKNGETFANGENFMKKNLLSF